MRIKRIFFFLIYFFLLSWFYPRQALGAFSFTISSINPSSVSSKDQEVEVTLSITDLPSESYFRVAWQEESGKPYFGYVQDNNGNWVKVGTLSDDCTSYYKVTDTTKTSLALKTKIGADTNIYGGLYNLKAHRFTSSSCSSTAGIDSFGIEVNLPTATPEPTSTPDPTPTPAPTETQTPKPTVLAVATKKPTIAPRPVTKDDERDDSDYILGLRDELMASPSPESGEEDEKKFPFVAGLFLFGGTGLIGVAGFTFFKNKKKEYNKDSKKERSDGFNKIEIKGNDNKKSS